MTAKECMIQALSDMLRNGEKLMHPIYGFWCKAEGNIMDILDLQKNFF